jgi:hypothetical protein
MARRDDFERAIVVQIGDRRRSEPRLVPLIAQARDQLRLGDCRGSIRRGVACWRRRLRATTNTGGTWTHGSACTAARRATAVGVVTTSTRCGKHRREPNEQQSDSHALMLRR